MLTRDKREFSLKSMLRFALILMTLLMMQVAHGQPVQAALHVDQSEMNSTEPCASDDSAGNDHCSNVHSSCSLFGSAQFNTKHVPNPNAWAPVFHTSGEPKYTIFQIDRPPKA